MTTTFESISTKAVHAGEPEPRIGGAVAMPIFQSSTFLHEGTSGYHDSKYVRLSNTPNHDALHAKIAAIENAEDALVTASGMAAISTALLTVLGSGDHLLMIDCPYGGTRNFVTDDLPRYGISVSFIDGADRADWAKKIRPTTRAIYVEGITNPLMQVPDLEGVVEFAREHGLVSMVDNTIPTPVNFRPAEIGFDLSLHSCTKYLNGHSDLAAGAVVGRAELIRKVYLLASHLGGMLDPHACALLHRGIKTLPLRVRHQNGSAIKIARFLAEHPAVECVHYPGLEGNPGYDWAHGLFDGYGGMLSFEVAGGVAEAEAFLERLTIPIHAVSLGGVESLVIRPAVTAYAAVSSEERARLGVTDRLIRMSVGIEDSDELIRDLDRALSIHAATC